MAETVSTRLPPKIIKMMEAEAKAKGITLSSLLREIIEEHYGLETSVKGEKSFLSNLQEAIEKLGGAKMSSSSIEVAVFCQRARLYPCYIHYSSS